jgi:hypothetical protein
MMRKNEKPKFWDLLLCGLGVLILIGGAVVAQTTRTEIDEDLSVGNDLTVFGKVGIDTSSPGHQLDVRTAAALGTAVGSKSDMVRIPGNSARPDRVQFFTERYATAGNTNEWTNAHHRMQRVVDSSSMGFIGWGRCAGSSTSLQLGYGTTIQMVIEEGGDVGIGTTTPSEKLEVAGNIRTTGGSFIDDGTTLTAPDYVFEDDYSLMPMGKLETFVEEHGHLPNIPSAEDIKSDGLNISQFQMRLLEKVEELTLYTISQQKEINELRAEIEMLKQSAIGGQ